MKLHKLNEILVFSYLVTILIAINSVTCSLSYENKDFVKIKQDPTRFQQISAYLNKKNIFSSRNLNVTTRGEKNKIGNGIHQISTRVPPNNKSASHSGPYKKWQVGRVSRKQYEIINMLWRKTKMFLNVEQTTPTYPIHLRRENDSKRVLDSIVGPHHSFLRFTSRQNLPSTTPSYIEFYYLDETDDRGKEPTSPRNAFPRNSRERQLKNFGNFKFVLDSPMFSFRIDDPSYKRSALPTRYMHPTNKLRRRKTRPHDSSLTGFDSLNSITPPYKFPHKRAKGSIKFSTLNKPIVNSTITNANTTQGSLNLNVTKLQDTSTTEYSLGNETCPLTTDTLSTLNDTNENETLADYSINVTAIMEPTTVYDKIKFFEIYDKQTPIPYYDEKGNLMDMDNVEIFVKGNELSDERKILLEHVDQSIENEHSSLPKTKHFKKHIIDNYKSESKNHTHPNLIFKKVMVKPVALNISMNQIIANVTKRPLKKTLASESTVTNFFEYKKSRDAQWSQYPFAAAYVYEPSQVHCDAAGISPHWLISSASCLSRHHKNPGGEGRSAFVTYCGESWWNPERVAYVKYSLVHPRYHPRDKTRRHLYNIGLIQVVTSMASACSGWSSITIMSHQFVADPEGSTANAIGWGLDRFDTRYSSNDLPKTPLMTYISQVYSDSCPGNIGYKKAKVLDEEGGVKNVYCLSLPPYTGEKNDPVHGGLLLVGGKLVALYLQEERRPWGEQCAQYTGTWRLVPWILDMARESEETDSFTLDI